MVDPRHAGATTLGPSQWAELDEPYDAEPVTTPGSQHLGELGIVDPSTDQCDADVLGHVEVAERNRVGVTQRS